MTEQHGYRVAASLHAAKRAVERLSMCREATRDDACRIIEGFAALALHEGRKARRCPRWCARELEEGLKRRGRTPTSGHFRFVWDEHETFAMVVSRCKDKLDPTKTVWLIVTVMAPEMVAA